jgi:hypothetical protein
MTRRRPRQNEKPAHIGARQGGGECQGVLPLACHCLIE